MSEIVRVRDAHVHFGEARAVDGVSLDVHPAEVLALVGESGSGKTTLIRAIQGLQPLTSGAIEDQGETKIGGRRRRRVPHDIQMVFQDPTGALNPRHTIYDIVAEGLRIRGDRRDEADRVGEALSRAGLRPPERFTGRYPHEISGGQRQRVVIAGAMVMSPRLLLADEPVASLDASIRGEVLGLMRSLVDDTGLSIVAVTHDLGLAWNIADRIAVMYLGRVVEIGTTEDVLEHPTHPYTRALLSVVPEMGRMEQQILVGETPDPLHIPWDAASPRCPLLASGEAERLGVAEACVRDDPALAGDGHQAACHAVPVQLSAKP
ncbi:MAG: ABC transporter ATP-binding protein [Acidimicrobiales bacterium]